MFELEIDILSYWLAGTGRGSGGSFDEKPLLDENGIPYIPGKHLKGLLKDGLRKWESITGAENPSAHIHCFGSDQDNENKEDNNKTKSTTGALRVSSATFDSATYEGLKTHPKLISKLFKSLSSTAINENGVATNKSLRTIQVVIPVKLYAQIDWVSASPYASEEVKEKIETYLQQASAMLPAIGSKRTRGLGRCKIALKKQNNGGNSNV